MKLHFYLRFYTKPGQQLFVSGNIPELGSNNDGRAFPLKFLSNDFWEGTLELPERKVRVIYHYLLKTEDGTLISEWDKDRFLDPDHKTDLIQLVDTWNHAGSFENAFYTAPFLKVLLPRHRKIPLPKSPKFYTHIFKVKAVLLKSSHVICISGSGTGLNEWSEEEPLLMKQEGNWWSIKLILARESFPLSYKYGVYDLKHKTFLHFETGKNRYLNGDAIDEKLTILHDGFIHLPNNIWKGTGVSIPVFSLRSRDSFGVGEFSDIRLLVDWAKKTGLKLIQILPVNDTSATFTWVDSYPYAAISAFALHPIYANLREIAGKKHAAVLKPVRKKQKQLNAMPNLDYEEVIKTKWSVLRELYELQKEMLFEDSHYQDFFESNQYWLLPYGAFCYLKEINGTADFTKWKTYKKYNKENIQKLSTPGSKAYDQIAIHYFIQYHLHVQLKKSSRYAHDQGIVLKGDVPIGIYRYSCDAWMAPDLYHMDLQAGAPPDPFTVKGQNWGFPTYNWQQMEKDGFLWWKQRFEQMACYFDAFRIDHILGFFRIWSIPMAELEGLMGYFDPAIPVQRHEFEEQHIWFDLDRYTKPFINDAVLWELFAQHSAAFIKLFLTQTSNGFYQLNDLVNSQRKAKAHFAGLEHNAFNDQFLQGIFYLIGNVILFEAPGSEAQQFHFRFDMETISSFRYLDWHLQQQLKTLYINYFYQRQDKFWKKQALKKLPALKQSTNMLVFGEDLGLVSDCVPELMKELGILSLEVQRMPKNRGRAFFHPADAPYLSVVTPSTHDMSTIRGWWEEDPAKTQDFFRNELGQWGDAPLICEPWINKAIVIQHLYSPAMWSIFQLQDLFGMNASVRRENPNDERINVPAESVHYWKYRMHFCLEDLIKEKAFNEELKEYIHASGR